MPDLHLEMLVAVGKVGGKLVADHNLVVDHSLVVDHNLVVVHSLVVDKGQRQAVLNMFVGLCRA